MNSVIDQFSVMKVQLLIVVALMVASSEAQFGGFRGGFRGFFRGVNQGVFQPMTHMFHHHVMQPVHHFVQRPQFHMPHFFGGQSEQFRGGKSVGNTRDKATEKPIATGHDTLYPEDCGRDDNNKGLLCFPDGLLCQNRKSLFSMNYSLEQVENFVDLSRKILVTKCLYFNHDLLIGSGHITLAIFSVYIVRQQQLRS